MAQVHSHPADRRLAASETTLLPANLKAGSRATILDRALRLFAEQGYAGTSVRELAEAAGMTPASIYAHFPSKAQVLAELCEIGHQEHSRRVRRALLEAGADPVAQIAAFVRAHVSLHTEFPMLAVVANAELHMLPAELGAATFALRTQTIDTLGAIVGRGMELGAFDVADAWLATAAIGAMGLRVAYWYTNDYDKSGDEIAATYVQFALRLLGAESGTAPGSAPGDLT